jgi:hypothetical protein
MVHFRRASCKIQFANYDELLHGIQSSPKFGTILLYQDFSINLVRGAGDAKVYIPVTEDKFPSDFPSKLVIILNSKGFSQVKSANDQEEALSYIGCLFKRVDAMLLTTPQDDIFPHNVDTAKFTDFDDAITAAERKLDDKLELANLSVVSECTMRGFIDIILDESVRVVVRYLKRNKFQRKLSVVYERQLTGLHGHGPVDYSILLDFLDIVLTEAKKGDLKSGLLQNLLQQRAALEFLANMVIGKEVKGVLRKRKFSEMFDQLRFEIPTFGIVSTAKEWQFSRSVGVNEEYQSTSVKLSQLIQLPFQTPSPERTNALKVIMGTIVNILDQQVTAVSSNEVKLLRSFGMDFDTVIACEVAIASNIAEQTESIGEEDDNEDADEI